MAVNDQLAFYFSEPSIAAAASLDINFYINLLGSSMHLKNRPISTLLSSSLFTMVIFSSFGNATFAELPEVDDEILVTATRNAKSQSDIIIANQVITREDIENSGSNDLAEILRFSAGLDIGRNGGPGQTTSVFIRGTESNHTLVLVDGIEINPGTIGGAAIQNIKPEIIERIEIIKGPRSSLYGSEAIGGVINIITRKAEKTTLSTSISYGSDDNKQISAHSAFREEDYFASFTLDWTDTDGFASLRDQTEARGHDNLSFNFRGGMKVFNQDIELTHWQASGNTEYFGYDTSTFETGPLAQDFQNSASSLKVSSDINELWKSKLILGLTNDSIDQNQLDYFFFPEPLKDKVETNRLSLDWQNTFQLANNSIVAGAYFEREDAESLSFGSAYSDKTESKAIYAGFDGKLGILDSNLAARYTDNETAGNQTSWNLEFAYGITPNLKTGITAGQAFRAPDATDRYGFGGNPALKTEESTSLSAVVKYQSKVGKFALDIFQTKIDDLIETVNVDPINFIFQNINIAETKIKGAELSHSVILNDWNLETTAFVQSPKNKSDDSLLLRRARRTLTSHIHRDFDKFNLGLQLLASSKRADIDAVSFGPVQTAGYILSNLTGSYQVNENMSLFAKVDNLLDADYATAAGYAQSGRNYQLSLRLHY